MPDDNKKQRGEFVRLLSLLSQIGFMIAACILAGIFLGRFLDRALNTSPWLLILFTLLGIAGAFVYVYDVSKRN